MFRVPLLHIPLGLAAILLGSCNRTEPTNLSALFVFFFPALSLLQKESKKLFRLCLWSFEPILLFIFYCSLITVCMHMCA